MIARGINHNAMAIFRCAIIYSPCQLTTGNEAVGNGRNGLIETWRARRIRMDRCALAIFSLKLGSNRPGTLRCRVEKLSLNSAAPSCTIDEHCHCSYDGANHGVL